MLIERVLALHLRHDAVLDAERCHLDTPFLDLIARMHGRGWRGRRTALFQIGRPEGSLRSADTWTSTPPREETK